MVTRHPRTPTAVGPAPADMLAARVGPTSARRDRVLPLLPPLVRLFPDGGLQRGTVVGIDSGGGRGTRAPGSAGPGGATTLAFSLLAAASTAGSWCAAVGTADPGVVAMADLGIDLHRLVIVPLSEGAGGVRPEGDAAWAEVVATLLDGMDVVLLRLPWPARPRAARRLAARTRERRAVLLVLGPPAWWPEGPDVRVAIGRARWDGVGEGHGHLQGRRAEVLAAGRRAATRPAVAALWLPAASGGLSEA